MPWNKDNKSIEPSKAEGDDEEEEVEEPIAREAWKNKREYLLALIGLCIGYGNIWRFPYVLQKNGGAAFLIPCAFFLTFVGIPLFFMDMALGQRMRRGSIGSFNAISPYLTGVGISAGFACALVCLYYNILFAWCISYFVWSWTFPKLPWAQCKNYTRTTPFLLYDSILDGSNQTFAYPVNITEDRPNQECELAGPAQYYWFRETLDVSSDITDYGNWNWSIFCYQILAWTIVTLCLAWGTNSLGKVSNITGILPFVVLLIFFIMGFFLEDFAEGFRILFAPDWGKLLKGKVWLDAGAQIFFSLSLGFGLMMTFASYSPSHSSCHRDALFVPLLSLFTSLWASCVMFMILGFKGMKEFKKCLQTRNDTIQALLDIKGLLSDYLNRNWTLKSINFPHDHFISNLNVTLHNDNGSEIVVDAWGFPENSDDLIYAKHCDKETIVKATGSGTGLIFITFAEAVTSFPASQLWSILFLVMMISLGLGSEIGMLEGVICCIQDLKLFNVKRWKIVLVTCTGFLFIGACIFSPGNGMYFLAFFDEMVVEWPLLIISLCQVITISYFYGLDRLSYEIKLMTGYRPNAFLLLCWKIISPLIILIILIFSVIFQITEGATYQRWRKDLGMNDDPVWRGGYIAMALVLDLLIIGWIPLVAILMYNGIRVLKDPPAEFPEEELMELRNYDPDEDRRTTSTFQLAIMAKSLKDMTQALTSKSVKESESKKSTEMTQDHLELMESEIERTHESENVGEGDIIGLPTEKEQPSDNKPVDGDVKNE